MKILLILAKKLKLNFSCSALFHMETAGSLKDFVADCGIKKRMYEFEKDTDVDLFYLDLFPSHYI